MERFVIRNENDISIAVLAAQARARSLGLSAWRVDRLGTAVSELAHNIIKYAQGSGGDLLLELDSTNGQRRLTLQARDNGPGIEDIASALRDHYSSAGTLGLGLPGVRRMVDDFQILSIPGSGTIVTITMEEKAC